MSQALSGSRPINWVKREPPKKFDFGHGVCLVGVLMSLEKVSVRDQTTKQPKLVMRYTVRELQDDQSLAQPVFFFGTTQLDSLLGPSDVGHYVSITCTGEDKTTVVQGRNAMKTWDVSVSANTAPGWANDGTPITDDDLPPADVY